MLLEVLLACSEMARESVRGPGAAEPRDAPDAPVPPERAAPTRAEPPAPRAEPPAPAAFLFAEPEIHRFDLTLSDDAWDGLRSGEDEVPGTLRYGAEEWVVGVRTKGSHSWRSLSEKAAFKFDFGAYHDGARFHGLRRLTFNNMVQDRSMIREHVIYRAYAAVGVPAPRHTFAELWIDGELWGLYGVLDTMDRHFARWAFPEDGEGWLYEGGGGADFLAGREDRFQVQAAGEGEPYADVEALVEALDRARDLDEVFDRIDRSALRMWATDLLSGNRDGYTRRRNNYLVYHGAERWWFVPWGNDQALRDGMGVHEGLVGRVTLDCVAADGCDERLDAAIAEVASTWAAIDLAGFAEATGERVIEACARDPRREDPCGGHDDVVELIEARIGAYAEE